MLFGERTLDQFDLRDKTIKDAALTHPNVELRLAFMNYYLHPTPEKRQQIDEIYLQPRNKSHQPPINRSRNFWR